MALCRCRDSQGKWLDVPPTNGLVAFDARLVVVNPQTPPPKKWPCLRALKSERKKEICTDFECFFLFFVGIKNSSVA